MTKFEFDNPHVYCDSSPCSECAQTKISQLEKENKALRDDNERYQTGLLSLEQQVKDFKSSKVCCSVCGYNKLISELEAERDKYKWQRD